MFGILISTLVSLLIPICLLFLFPLGIKLFIVLNDRKRWIVSISTCDQLYYFTLVSIMQLVNRWNQVLYLIGYSLDIFHRTITIYETGGCINYTVLDNNGSFDVNINKTTTGSVYKEAD